MSNTICAVPWIHLNIDPDGDVLPCCEANKRVALGNVNKQPLHTIWNSEVLRSMRLQMLAGEQPELCTRCYTNEQTSGISTRLYKNQTFKEDIDAARARTNPDGSVDKITLKYWDFRFSNICNYKCRTCGPKHSTAWIPDYRQLAPHDKKAKKLEVTQIDLESTDRFIEKHIDEVQQIYFAGGEPLLMDIHWYILDELVKRGRTNISIGYNTNLSKLEYNGKSIIEYWKHFDQILLWPSIDEIGDRAEFVRAGTNWSHVDKNLEVVVAQKNILLKPSITVSCYNVFRITEILDYLLSKGVEDFNLNIVNHHSFTIDALPIEYRQRIEKHIRQWLEGKDLVSVQLFERVFHQLQKPQNIAAAHNFVKNNKRLDSIRKENTFDIIPELLCVEESIR